MQRACVTTILLNFAYLWMVAAVFETLVPHFQPLIRTRATEERLEHLGEHGFGDLPVSYVHRREGRPC